MLKDQFEPKVREKEIYDFWLKENAFKADNKSNKEKYSIVMPPPNVTGVLHMGHALMCVLEDIIIRRKRMQGFNTLWLPGTDHAGIATQMVVERNLMQETKQTKHDLGREKFLEKVWQWKDKSQETILNQLKLIGCSVDWDRLAFTLDENVSKSVRECFVRLYQDGLIYREESIIQWCPRCRTALSDLEVKFKETKGKLYHIKYLLKEDPNKYLIVATTRPETLLGDVAVAVHPEDERYKEFHGKKVILPLLKKEIPVITDTYVDIQFGTGALKITPGHDTNDYLIGKKHKLPVITILDENAKLNAEAKQYSGLSREKGREKILNDLTQEGLLEKETDHLNNVSQCDRCATVVEPRVSQQWFVKAEILAKPAIEAVEKKEIKIIPEEWEKTYFEWMRNIRPWCISRQLWWGHRIPVWYCNDCKHQNVKVETPKSCEKCKSLSLRQEEDVLDTWFSSGLWPFSTLGWPEKTDDMKAFYPTDVLETGFDILFFWVARMIMLGIKMTGKIPFHTVYLHPMVRDEHGQKMSKTKGNVVDPLEIIDRMGTDALRFYLAWNAFHGRDVRVSDDGVDTCRHFVNKIWNASRFVLMHFSDVKEKKRDMDNEVNAWIWGKLEALKVEVENSLDQYRFFEAAQSIYHFLWNDYCDWFIELIKPKEELEKRKAINESTAIEVLEETLRLLHPFMPFVTEEIWQAWPLRSPKTKTIALAEYPMPDPKYKPTEALGKVNGVISIIEKVRTTRGVLGVPFTQEISLWICPEEEGALETVMNLQKFDSLFRSLAKANQIEYKKNPPTEKKEYLALIIPKFHIYVAKKDLGDLTLEIERRKKELVDKELALLRANEKLKNEKFIQSAPKNVIEGVEKNKSQLEKDISGIQSYLKELA